MSDRVEENIFAKARRQHQLGQLTEAETLYRRLVADNPKNVSALYFLAAIAAGRGDHAAADDWLHQVVELAPNHAEAYYNLGNAQREQGKLEKAVTSFEQTLTLKPNYPEAHHNLGLARLALGQLDLAVASLQQAIALKRDYAEAHHNLGIAFKKLGQTGDAISSFRTATALRQDSPEFFKNLGSVLIDDGRLDEALESFERALALKPDYFEALHNIGNVRHKQGHLHEAEASYRRAIALNPEHVVVLNKLGGVLQEQNRLDDAAAYFSRAIAVKPNFFPAHNNLGNVFYAQCKADEAIARYRQAIALQPDHPGAHHNLSMLLLLKGDFANGLAEYEWRWRREDIPFLSKLAAPAWSGELRLGETILLRAEQGFGDAIQFVRYAKLVRERCGRVILQCIAPLARLLATAPGIDEVITTAEEPSGISCHAPLLNLMRIFNTRLETIPDAVPYLAVDPTRFTPFEERICASSGLKVGLVWAGNPQHTNDRNRSLALKSLAPLFAVKGVSFISLQKGTPADEIAANNLTERLVNLAPQLDDFADTAAAISCLDLVISVDTVIAHLAGALGKPVWTLLPFAPDWRWLLDRKDSPWYPTMRLYRQQASGDWASVVAPLVADLSRQAQEHALAPNTSHVTAPQLSEGLRQLQADRFFEAKVIFSRILDVDPNHVRALYYLGIIVARQGDLESAATFFKRALAISPAYGNAHYNLGNALRALGRTEDAVSHYRRATALEPSAAEAFANLAEALQSLGRSDEAAVNYQHAIRLKPNDVALYGSLGNALHALGRSEDAMSNYRRAIALDPHSVESHNNLGNILQEQGNLDDAVKCFERVLAIEPSHAGAYYNLGNAFAKNGRLEEAVLSYEHAIALNPDYAVAHNNLGNALTALGKLDEAATSFRRVLVLKSDYAGAHNNFSTVLVAQGKLDEAVTNLQRALDLAPDIADIHQNLGIALLLKGDFAEGLEEYEWRLKAEAFSALPKVTAPAWDGTPAPGKTVLLQAEQGIGDAIQFARYAPLVRERCGRVILQCAVPLAPLFATAPGIDEVIITAEASSGIAGYAPLLSLMRIFGTRLETIPATVPYLAVDPARAASFKEQIEASSGLKVGLVWAGNPRHKNDRNRSLALAALAPIFAVEGARFFSLQKGASADEIATNNLKGRLVDLAPYFEDLADTAAAISCLDLIISVDTAAAHLAGALGKPVWTLLPFAPDWRWLLDRQDSPWYPTMRLYRQQTPGNWVAVINAVTEALRQVSQDKERALPTSGRRQGMVSPTKRDNAVLAEANRHHAAGGLAEAETLYHRHLASSPNDYRVLHRLGIIAGQRGDHQRAEELIDRALCFAPKTSEMYCNLGHAQFRQGRVDEAIASFRCALTVDPNDVDAHYNLAVALHTEGRWTEAESHYRKILALNPNYAKALNNLGSVLKQNAKFEEATSCFERSLILNPGLVEAHLNLGFARQVQGRLEEATACYERVLALQPDCAEAKFALCMAQLPILYADEAGITECRARYERHLRALCNDVDQANTLKSLAQGVGASQPFYLAYQGHNDRDLQTLYGSFVCRVMAQQYPSALLSQPPSLDEPIKVGVVSSFFRQHSVWKIPIKGWISQLDRRRFRLFGYYTDINEDAETKVAATFFDRFIQGPLSLDRWRQTILADAPHVLIYPEVGMHPMTTQLAALRLAPVQCNSWGHPDTSGFPTLDYYLSSELMEPPDAQDHYSERLIRLPNLSIYYEPLDIAQISLSRQELGLRSSATVYWCGQSLFKYLPQFDQVFPRIAQEVGDCQFIFIRYHTGRHVNELFWRRLDRAFASFGLKASNYCVVVPHFDRPRFSAAMGQCDIVLDSIEWSGCNSTLESLIHDLPIVTMTGSLMRGRHSMAILKMMGVTETIAETIADYVSIAVRLARDMSWKRTIKKKVSDNKHRVYRDRTCVSALEDFLTRVVRR